jgi:hypothetical protein
MDDSTKLNFKIQDFQKALLIGFKRAFRYL